MTFKVTSKSLLRRAVREIGARTHYLSERFEHSRKQAKDRMVAIRRRNLRYRGHSARIIHTLSDGRQVKYTVEIV